MPPPSVPPPSVPDARRVSLEDAPPPPKQPPQGACGATKKDCGCGGLNRNAVMGKISRRLTQVVAKEEHFEGGLLGVRAEVVLMRQANKAKITLSGLPMGGTVSGDAVFAEGIDGAEKGAVVVSEPLATVLRRRAVKLVGAEYDKASDTVKVVARLPIVGTRHIVLKRRAD